MTKKRLNNPKRILLEELQKSYQKPLVVEAEAILKGEAEKRSISGMAIIEDDASESQIDFSQTPIPLNFYLSTKSEIPLFGKTTHSNEVDKNDFLNSSQSKVL